MLKKGINMTIKELEKEIKEKITVLDKDELKEVIKFIDQLQAPSMEELDPTIDWNKFTKELTNK